MFDHILVPLDGSPLAECVLPHVVTMARVFDSRVSLLRVLEECHTSENVLVDPLDWQMWRAEGEAYLGEQAARLWELGIRAEQVLEEGRAAERIVEYARDNDVGLIVTSSHGWSGLSPWNVGGVVQKIISRAHTSTLIVRAYHTPDENLVGARYDTVLAPLDGSVRAQVALPAVRRLERTLGARVLLAHVVRQPEMPAREPLSEAEIDMMNRVTDRNRAEGLRYLDQLRERLGQDAEAHLLYGHNAAIALHEFVEEQQVDLVVLSAHGHSGMAKQPYGSITLNFIVHGTRPLLIVQDLSPEEITPTQAELAVRERKGH